MIRRTLTRDLLNRSRVIVRLELREKSDPGTLSPGFSVTGSVYEAHGTHSGESRHRRECEPDSSGCVHDAVLKAFPELTPLVALHLSSPTGEPMHAEANSLYFYRAARGLSSGWTDNYGYAEREGLTPEKYALRAACSTLRVDAIPLAHVSEEELPAAFRKFVDKQRERWQREALAGRELMQALPVDGHNPPSSEEEVSRFFTAATIEPSSRAVLDRTTGIVCIAPSDCARHIAAALDTHARLTQIMENARANRTNWIAELEALRDATATDKPAR